MNVAPLGQRDSLAQPYSRSRSTEGHMMIAIVRYLENLEKRERPTTKADLGTSGILSLLSAVSGKIGSARHYAEKPRINSGLCFSFVSGSGGCSLGSAGDLAFGAEPIFNLVTASAPSLLVQLVGATTDLFRDCLCAAPTGERRCFRGNSHNSCLHSDLNPFNLFRTIQSSVREVF